MPLISVVMPVYKVEQYIADSVRSVCRQTFRNFELILVDDGSPDNSIHEAQKVLSEYDVACSVYQQSNQGVSAARNAGMMQANGEWVVCVDPDDGLHERTLELVANVIQNEPRLNMIGINHCVAKVISAVQLAQPVSDAYSVYSKEEIISRFLQRQTKLIAPGLFIRRRWLEESGVLYDPDTRYSEDQLFTWEALAKLDCVGFLQGNLYHYLVRPSSTMKSSPKEKVLTGYRAFCRLDIQIQQGQRALGRLGHMVLPRWVLGVLRASAKYMRYDDFMDLARALEFRQNMKRLRVFPEMRAKVLAWILNCNCYLFYLISKNM